MVDIKYGNDLIRKFVKHYSHTRPMTDGALLKLGYDNDWNKLMEVVEFIEELGSFTIMDRKQYDAIEISRKGVKIYFQKNYIPMLQLEIKPVVNKDTWKHSMYRHHIFRQYDFKNLPKIGAVYIAIVVFIEWYNDNVKEK